MHEGGVRGRPPMTITQPHGPTHVRRCIFQLVRLLHVLHTWCLQGCSCDVYGGCLGVSLFLFHKTPRPVASYRPPGVPMPPFGCGCTGHLSDVAGELEMLENAQLQSNRPRPMLLAWLLVGVVERPLARGALLCTRRAEGDKGSPRLQL